MKLPNLSPPVLKGFTGASKKVGFLNPSDGHCSCIKDEYNGCDNTSDHCGYGYSPKCYRRKGYGCTCHCIRNS